MDSEDFKVALDGVLLRTVGSLTLVHMTSPQHLAVSAVMKKFVLTKVQLK